MKEFPFALMAETYEGIMREAREEYSYASYRDMEQTVDLNPHAFSNLKKGQM